MDDKFPESVDVIVLGAGLPEAILAAACGRAGLSVLHLDRNDYYGGDWASFTMTMVHEVAEEQTSKLTPEDISTLTSTFLNSGEKLVELGDRKTVDDIEMTWLPRESDEKPMKEKLEELKRMRQFSIDLMPKILLSKGNMVQTLCDSQVTHYAEFQLVDRQLCPSDTSSKIALNPVPCSKGEIFQSNVLTIMEKRALMKFITFCTQWSSKSEEEQLEALGDMKDRPFSEFLAKMGVAENLQAFIIHTIGILETKPTALSGMRACCEFMNSVGHFGASPFLFPQYGCGELPQCFSRLAAVFGSLYALGRPVQAMVEEEGRITAVIADNQRVNCRHVIMSSRFVPEHIPPQTTQKFDRIVFATDKSLKESPKEMVTLLNLAALRPDAEISRVVEAGFRAGMAPIGHFLIHATGTQEGTSSIQSLVDRILEENEISPYWKMSFTMNSMKFDSQELGANNIVLAPPIDPHIHYASVIEECRQIFCATWPDLDFLPRAMRKEQEEYQEEEEEYQEKEINEEEQKTEENQ